MQYCDDCYFTTNGCNPMVQTVNWCYSTAGQSGSPIFDLTDYRVLGVLSGGPRAGSFAYADQLTVWTPIDAAQYATLTKWMWREGTSPNATAASAPVLVSRPASWCECVRQSVWRACRTARLVCHCVGVAAAAAGPRRLQALAWQGHTSCCRPCRMECNMTPQAMPVEWNMIPQTPQSM